MNAFQLVRPRGPDMPAKVPTKPKKAPVPITYSKQPARVLNARGFKQASLEPDASRSIVIESRAQAQASTDKRRRISPSGTK
jgi:hypothetical protein